MGCPKAFEESLHHQSWKRPPRQSSPTVITTMLTKPGDACRTAAEGTWAEAGSGLKSSHCPNKLLLSQRNHCVTFQQYFCTKPNPFTWLLILHARSECTWKPLADTTQTQWLLWGQSLLLCKWNICITFSSQNLCDVQTHSFRQLPQCSAEAARQEWNNAVCFW